MKNSSLQDFLDQLEKNIRLDEKANDNDKQKVGLIKSYKDGVIAVYGLADLKMSEMVEVAETGSKALVMNLEKNLAYALVLSGGSGIKEGMTVVSSGQQLSIGVGDNLLGRVVDPLGNALDGGKELHCRKHYPIEKLAPGVMDRKSVHKPMQTGILAIDALIPVGRGQRELIIGDRQTGKTTIALDTIINQKNQDVICVYAAIGQREAKTANVLELLKKSGAMDYTVIVSAASASSAVLQFLAPFSAMAIAEYFMDQGKDVLVVMDDLSKHAVAYREMSLLLRRPPGREAFPGDVFYLHSRLLERAASLNEAKGGGSITALPIIETQANDVSAYIPTNVISITDGQIFLESNLFYKGVRPAINVGISVSRVGGAAQTKIVKKISGTAKLDLAQYYELEAFSQFSSELDESAKQKLIRGKRVVEVLKQKQARPYKLWQEVVLLVAATRGYLDQVPEQNCQLKITELLEFMGRNKVLIAEIETKKEWTKEIEQEILELFAKFFN